MDNLDTGFFVGEFRHSLDVKGRLTIPASWRIQSTGKRDAFLALPNPDGYITVYGPEMIAQLRERIAKIGMADIEAQRALAQTMAKAQSFSVDKQGRINLNAQLLKHSGIEKDAVLLGKITSFSIYNASAYDAQSSADTVTLSQALARFGL
jgi:MraZ protein